MSTNKCILCQQTNFSELASIEQFPLFFGAIPTGQMKDVDSYPLTIAICENCSLVQQVNLLDEDLLNRVYTADYYNCPSPVSTGMGVREINKFHSFLTNCELEKGKLLEIACFDGYLLKQLKEDGWDVYGCDPSAMTKIAVDALGKGRIINDFFSKNTYPADSFDVVLFRNLLEHLYNIHDFIDDVSYCLKPGGRILIDVPNIHSLIEIGGFGTFFHQHVSYFSIQTLARLMEIHSFTVEAYHEGNPNLFISAVKNDSLNDLKKPAVTFQEKDIEHQRKIFKQKNQEVRSQIDRIFLNNDHQRIAVFGASALATTIVNTLSTDSLLKITNIFDNDMQKHGKCLFGCDVLIESPENINDSQFDVILITTYFFDDEIQKQLIDSGIQKNKIKKII